MNLIPKFLRREERSSSIGDVPLAHYAGEGPAVTARTAENLSAVLACVDAIATAVASLPAYVYERSGKARQLDDGHPLAHIIRDGANTWQTWPDWVEWTFGQVLLRGNALSEIVTDAAGNVVALHPIPWDWVSVFMLPSGRLAYDVTEQVGVYGAAGRRRRLLDGEVLHLRDRSDDGLIGRSRLSRAGEVVGAGLSLQEASYGLWRNGIFPSGALESDHRLTYDQKEGLADSLRRNHGGPSRGRVLLLDQGLKWRQITISPEDAEVLESRRFTVEEICRLFRVPPPLVQDLTHGTFTNSKEAGQWFVTFCLTPWIRKVEAMVDRVLLSNAGRELELDLSGFMRGDYTSRWQAHEIAVRNGILDINEVREVEGWNPKAETPTPPPAAP